jgi:hypothetical protein
VTTNLGIIFPRCSTSSGKIPARIDPMLKDLKHDGKYHMRDEEFGLTDP